MVLTGSYYLRMQVWTVQHYLTPHRRTVRIAGEDSGFLPKVKSALLIPTTSNLNSKRHVACSLFYTAVVTLPFVTTMVYWLVLYRSNMSLAPRPVVKGLAMHRIMGSVSFSGRCLREFLVINLNLLNSVIALVEIMVLSSVRKQKVTSRSNYVRSRS